MVLLKQKRSGLVKIIENLLVKKSDIAKNHDFNDIKDT